MDHANQSSFKNNNERANFLPADLFGRVSRHKILEACYTQARWNSPQDEMFLRYTYLSLRAENWKFPPRGETDILTFLHDISNVSIL